MVIDMISKGCARKFQFQGTRCSKLNFRQTLIWYQCNLIFVDFFPRKRKSSIASVNQIDKHLITWVTWNILLHWKCHFSIRNSFTIGKVMCPLVEEPKRETWKWSDLFRLHEVADDEWEVGGGKDRHLNGEARNDWVEWMTSLPSAHTRCVPT